MKATVSEIKALAKEFLLIADSMCDMVDNYFDGSNRAEDINAYEMVKDAEVKFVNAVNSYYGENDYEACLNYELAESWAIAA